MPKRPADEHGGGHSPKLPTRRRRWRHHLYLVLDDWELGYSIRKVDLSSGSDSDDDAAAAGRPEQCLPRAVFRLEAPRGSSGQFVPFGTRIMFMGTSDNPWGTVPMYDVRARALTSAPRRDSETNPFCCAYVQVDGKLFIVDEGSFEMLRPPPPPLDNGPVAGIKVKFDWSWCALPSPPYHNVISHAMHPDQRTMVFSMTKYSMKKRTRLLATFSFDLESSRWTRHGEWALPFKGRGYFDRDLDAWVGLSCDPDTLGHLCACDVLSAEGKDDGQPPACKLSKERLFCVDTAEKHIGATLVYVGGDRSMFCLVQYLSVDDHQGNIWKESLPECLRYLLRITTFCPKYDKHGDLRIAKCRHVGSYQLPEIATVYDDHLKSPVAFWIFSLINKFHEQLRMQRVAELQVEVNKRLQSQRERSMPVI